MTITQTFENLSAETPDAVDIAQMPSSWVVVDAHASSDGKVNATVSKIAGESVGYPLVRRIEVRQVTGLFHPDHPADRFAGLRIAATLYSTVKVANSVSGEEMFIPVSAGVVITYGAEILDNIADLQQFILSVNAELWSSVTTGVPDTSRMNKAALGASKLD
jgi:hypothetical protein